MAPCRYRLASRLTVLIAIGLSAVTIRAAEPAAEQAPAVDFARDVQPLFTAHCVSCHGPERQESGLRLDRRDAALKGGDGGTVISANKPAESPLLERIASTDPDLQMPPKGERLPAEAVARVRVWIEQGAAWPADAETAREVRAEHWSLKPLVRPSVPAAAGSSAMTKNPIDAFVAAKLDASQLTASPPADRRILLRRVTFDLTGLPPTPEAMAAFAADTADDAYERVVDRLLASPRYGERWARHWMDVAHFAETHGHDQDRPREHAWPYRDYLIRSFNDDKPYARFVSEQVAGDVLEPNDPQAVVALGFLAAGPWDESSLMCIVDDTTDKKLAQVLDRDDMISNVMSTFSSTTIHCARCHNHKFDPIPQADYYSLQAVFAGVDRADRPFDADATVHRRRRELTRDKHDVAALTIERLAADARLKLELSALEAELQSGRDTWKVVVPTAVSSGGATAMHEADGSVVFSGTHPEKDTYTLSFETTLPTITAVQIEVLPDASLPGQGPGRADNGNLHLSEFKLLAQPVGAGESAAVPIASAFADFDQEGWGVAAAIDGKVDTAWGIHPQEGKAHAAVFVLRQPMTTQGGARLTVVLEQLHGRSHLIGRTRVSVTSSANPAASRPVPTDLAPILARAPAARSSEQQLTLARWLLGWHVDRQLAALPAPQEVYAACHEFKGGNNFRPAAKPRPVHLLRRGDINQPLEEAAPGALTCVAGIESHFALASDEDEGSRRVALARWLVDPRNVLTWRSIVNRIWHYHFDRGISDTPNDLGRMGGVPSHPELLDWLALEFRDSGGSLKQLHRLIVTSATYRQSSAIDGDKARVDADNRLLWRMNARRLDAESLRDAVLSASGKLDLAMGGPSVRQFVESKGIHVTPNIDYLNYDVDSPGNFRRSVYRFLFRTLPDPLMESLDCPDGSQFSPVRNASMTALQALSLLDNRFVVRQSEHTAARLAAARATTPERIALLFSIVLLREPSAEESQKWCGYAERHGLANACRMMFNTNEFVFVN